MYDKTNGQSKEKDPKLSFQYIIAKFGLENVIGRKQNSVEANKAKSILLINNKYNKYTDSDIDIKFSSLFEKFKLTKDNDNIHILKVKIQFNL